MGVGLALSSTFLMPKFEAESPSESAAVRKSRFVACLAFDYRASDGKVRLQLAKSRGKCEKLKVYGLRFASLPRNQEYLRFLTLRVRT